MAEGARLESVYRGNSIQGSNPCLSAILASYGTYQASKTLSIPLILKGIGTIEKLHDRSVADDPRFRRL